MARALLFYTHAFSGGGAELVFARLARAFAEAGDRVIFAADHPGRQPVADARGLRHVVLGAGHTTATRRLAAILRRERPDASFSALGAQNLKHLAAALLAGRRAHCVLGVHGFAAAETKRLARLSYRLAPVTSRLAARTICVSDVLLDDMVVSWGARRDRLMRIYNPIADVPIVEVEETATTPAEPTADRPLVLALGRLDPVKRFDDLLAAFAAGAPAGARLAILGEGQERPALEAAITQLGLGGRVELPGHVADPATWYAAAAGVAVTSASESFGLTVAEALAHGLPVVATDCGGPAEVLGGLGRIVPVGDVAALADALAATLAATGDPGPRRRRAAAFALEPIVTVYAALADSLG